MKFLRILKGSLYALTAISLFSLCSCATPDADSSNTLDGGVDTLDREINSRSNEIGNLAEAEGLMLR